MWVNTTSACRPALHRPCQPRGAVMTLNDPQGGHFLEKWHRTPDLNRPTRWCPDPNWCTRRAIFWKLADRDPVGRRQGRCSIYHTGNIIPNWRVADRCSEAVNFSTSICCSDCNCRSRLSNFVSSSSSFSLSLFYSHNSHQPCHQQQLTLWWAH